MSFCLPSYKRCSRLLKCDASFAKGFLSNILQSILCLRGVNVAKTKNADSSQNFSKLMANLSPSGNLKRNIAWKAIKRHSVFSLIRRDRSVFGCAYAETGCKRWRKSYLLAPAARKRRMISSFSFSLAIERGVSPRLSFVFTFAPAERRIWTSSVFSASTAWCRAVAPV